MPGLDFEASVVAVLAGLRPGNVITYGEVAAEAGYPGAARAVGNFLRRTTEPVPWWRVVTASGRLAPGAAAEQRRRLEAEGVVFTGSGRVVPRTTPNPKGDQWPSASGN